MSGSDPDRFTLTEVTIILLVFFVIISVAVPTYFHFLKVARSVEAAVVLNHVASLEEAYYIKNKSYTDDLKALRYSPPAPVRFYGIEIALPQPQSFIARAKGNIDSDPELDVWTIDEKGILKHVSID